jgi:hypothetical protein
MATARVQFASITGGGTSLTATLGSPTTAGNLLLVFVSGDGSGSSAPTGIALTGSSDVFTQDANVADTNPTALVDLSLWSDPSCSGGHTAVVATFGASVAGTIMSVWEVSGAAVASPLAGAPAAAAAPASTLQALFDSGAAAAVAAGCFWVACVTGIGSGGRAQAVPGGSWTTETPLQPGGVTQMLPGYQAGPGAGSPEYSGTFSAPVAGAYWAAIAAAYSPAPVPATVSGQVSSLALAAPAGSVSATASVAGAAAALTFRAPAGVPLVAVPPQTWTATVNAGAHDVVLPNGLRYQAGQSAVLSAAQRSQMSASAPVALVGLGGTASYSCVLNVGLKDVVLPWGQRAQGGATVTLTDEQYGLLYARASSALFSSVTRVIS